MDKLRILVADDQTLMRDGLATIINLEEDMEVIATASNGKEAYKIALELKPDVILMDVRMPVLNGVEATKFIKSQIKEVAILILTTFDEEEYIIDSLANGATGYILKSIEGDNLIQAIKDAYNGDIILPSKIAIKLATKFICSENNIGNIKNNDIDEYGFTNREKEICSLLVSGYINKQICEKLFLTNGTVKNYVANIYNKLGVNNRTAAVLFLKKLLD